MGPGFDDVERRAPEFVAVAGLPPFVVAELDFRADRPGANVDGSCIAPTLRARAAVQGGDAATAREILDGVCADALGPHELAAAAWTVSRIGPRSLNHEVRDRLAVGPDFLEEGGLALGPRDLFVGMLDGADGRLPDAVDTLTRAAASGDRRNPFWGALARLELHRVQTTAGLCGAEIGDPRAAIAARTFFAAGGYAGFLAQLRFESGADATDDAAHPAAGVMRESGSWTVGFGVEPPVVVQASKGLRALRHLVRHPTRRVSALELDLVAGGDEAGADAVRDRLGAVLHAGGTADDEIPARLREALFDDAVRSRISKLIRRTVTRLGSTHTTLAAHLDASLETGYACRYAVTATSASWRT